MINASWNVGGTSNGLADSVGIMVYEGTQALQYVPIEIDGRPDTLYLMSADMWTTSPTGLASGRGSPSRWTWPARQSCWAARWSSVLTSYLSCDLIFISYDLNNDLNTAGRGEV